MSSKHPDGLFVVGDDDQSIYSWRGGSPDFIRRFKEDFGPDASVKALQVSFRCHPHVLEGAAGVISHFDEARIEKGPFSYKVKDGPKINVHNADSDEKEAFIVRTIIQRSMPSRSVLVLIPHRGFAAALCRSLFQAKIPFTSPPNIPGEGLPTLAPLGRWLNDTHDSLSLRACLQSFMDSKSQVPSPKSRKPEKKALREALLKEISALWKPVLSKDRADLWESLRHAHEEPSIAAQCHAAFELLLETHKAGTATGFIGCANDTLGLWRTPAAVIEETTAWVDYFEQASAPGQGSSVRIMSFQGAKGLEAHVVCVLGVEEGSLPRSADNDRTAEEARLFYVSATRAIEERHLFHARKRSGAIVFRSLFKGGKAPDLQPSRFLRHIEKTYKKEVYHSA